MTLDTTNTDVVAEHAAGPVSLEQATIPAGAQALQERAWSLPGHPAVAVIAVCLAALGLAAQGFGVEGWVAALTLGVLAVLAAIDLEHRVLPNVIVLPAAAVVLAAQLALRPEHALEWMLAPLAVGAFLALPRLVNHQGIGLGDVKLSLLLGAALGWNVFGVVLIACLAILPVALVLVLRGQEQVRKTAVPFGPFLTLGALVTFLTI